MKETVNNILTYFEPISLSEMDDVALMDRTDTKYTFRLESLPAFIESIKDSYRVLEVNSNRISRYESLYFDTKDFDLYNYHHMGKMNRFKIRFRTYVESNLHFFEIKFKNNKGRTVKNRIKYPQTESNIAGKAEKFLLEHSPFLSSSLEQKFKVNFSRITFVNRNAPERVTIDLNLEFVNDDKRHLLEKLVIAEVKQSKPFVSTFVRLMKDHHIRKGSLSKYCFGVMSLYEQQRFNNFKPQLLLLNKLMYGPSARA